MAGDDVLGLEKVYEIATKNQLDETLINKSLSDSISVSNVSFTSSAIFGGSGLQIILPFYNSLVKLLAWCSPDIEQLQATRGNSFNDNNNLSRLVQKNTHNILCSLISKENILGVLSLSFETAMGLLPKHKEVVLQFLDKVYGFTDAEFLTNLLFKSFIPDIKLALSLEVNISYLMVHVCHIVRSTVLP